MNYIMVLKHIKKDRNKRLTGIWWYEMIKLIISVSYETTTFLVHKKL